MKKDTSTLKTYFETGDYPTEAEFADLIDSFLNIDENDAVTGILDNGDGTYTFQLLTGASQLIDTNNLPEDIPIANILGLQAALDAFPSQYIRKDQDESTSGSIYISMGSFSGGKSFSVGAPGSSSYVSMDANGNAIFGNVSSNDGQNSTLIVKKNGELEFDDNGMTHTIWHSGNDAVIQRTDQNKNISNTAIAHRYYSEDVLESSVGNRTALEVYQDTLGADAFMAFHVAGDYAGYFGLKGDINDFAVGGWSYGNVFHRVWHGGNDGSGSGLDADLLDGLQGVGFTQSGDGISGDFNAIPTTASRLTSINANANTPFGNAWYTFYSSRHRGGLSDGNVWASQIAVGMTSYQNRMAFRTQTNGTWSSWSEIYHKISPNIEFTSSDLVISGSGKNLHLISGAISRGSHNAGYLEGSYNNIGANQTQSNPIYVIGSSYVPSASTLGNMYGIGYSDGSAAFLNSTDLGINPTGWGLYIASDGNARIFLDSGNGRGYFKDVIYASNFILNSDRRLKKDIEDLEMDNLPVKWRKFTMKGDEENQPRCGVIAQELLEIAPEFVNSDDEGNLTVKYIDLLVAKMAEKDKQNIRFEKMLKSLESKIAALEN